MKIDEIIGSVPTDSTALWLKIAPSSDVPSGGNTWHAWPHEEALLDCEWRYAPMTPTLCGQTFESASRITDYAWSTKFASNKDCCTGCATSAATPRTP
jgi:hypothetical protein